MGGRCALGHRPRERPGLSCTPKAWPAQRLPADLAGGRSGWPARGGPGSASAPGDVFKLGLTRGHRTPLGPGRGWEPSPGPQATEASLGNLQMRKQSHGREAQTRQGLHLWLMLRQPTHSLFPTWGTWHCLPAPLPATPPWGGLGQLWSPASRRGGASPSRATVAWGGHCCRTAPHPPPPTPAIRLWLVSSWYCLSTLGTREPWGTDGT